MKYLDFNSIRSWELALSPRSEGRYSAITFRSGAIYRVKIGERYTLEFSRDLKGSRIFTLLCEEMISCSEIISLGAPLSDYMKALQTYVQWGEALEDDERRPDRRVIFTGDYPSA